MKIYFAVGSFVYSEQKGKKSEKLSVLPPNICITVMASLLTDWDLESHQSRYNEILTNNSLTPDMENIREQDYLKQFLTEVLLVKLAKFSQTKFLAFYKKS